MNTKIAGDVAELAVAMDLRRQGHKVAFPFGENWDADLIAEVDGNLQRVQVKHTRSDGVTVEVRCYTQTIVGGRRRSARTYAADRVDWLAVYDATTGGCIYLPSRVFGGRTRLHVRYQPSSRRRRDVRLAENYRSLTLQPPTLDRTGP